jgi:hypothetical protein
MSAFMKHGEDGEIEEGEIEDGEIEEGEESEPPAFADVVGKKSHAVGKTEHGFSHEDMEKMRWFIKNRDSYKDEIDYHTVNAVEELTDDYIIELLKTNFNFTEDFKLQGETIDEANKRRKHTYKFNGNTYLVQPHPIQYKEKTKYYNDNLKKNSIFKNIPAIMLYEILIGVNMKCLYTPGVGNYLPGSNEGLPYGANGEHKGGKKSRKNKKNKKRKSRKIYSFA